MGKTESTVTSQPSLYYRFLVITKKWDSDTLINSSHTLIF